MTRGFAVCLLLAFLGGCEPASNGSADATAKVRISSAGLLPAEPAQEEYLSGGEATSFNHSKDAFSRRPQAIARDFKLDGAFSSGDHLFRNAMDGFGPLLNTNTCQGCHLNDGRGVVPEDPSQPFSSMLVKIGDSSGQPDPVYGDQIQTFSTLSFTSTDKTAGLPRHGAGLEGELRGEAYGYITYQQVNGQYADGTPFQLRQPVYRFRDLSYGNFIEDIQFSARVAPQVFGTGLLEAIPADDLISKADPDDMDGDGISGRVSWVTDAISEEKAIGRFAYKAQTPSVLQQVAAAFNGDSGLTSRIFPQESCTPAQTSCLVAARQENRTGKAPDVDDLVLAFIEFYNRTLAVPARRGYDKDSDQWQQDVVAGRQTFMQLGCASCHTPRHQTGRAKGSVLGQVALGGILADAPDIEVLSNQTIYPYTDLLLHDMGGQCKVRRETRQGKTCDQGEACEYVQRCSGLADGLVQGEASGSEWKTPALWGLGLVQTVNPNAGFLHDGRAQSIEEAVLWHGGEAHTSQQAYLALDKTSRSNLLAFLYSL